MRVCEFGEEKILWPIFEGLGIENGVFVDIGAAGPYSNTDWLAAQGWRGIQVDGGVQEWPAFEKVVALPGQYITADGAPKLVSALHVDFLSIDVDGMDYWLLKAILDAGHTPKVVCVEFNQSKIAEDDIQPYDPNFVWPGGTTFGCSWRALNALAERHGYILCFKNLVNCIFVRNVADTIRTLFPKASNS